MENPVTVEALQAHSCDGVVRPRGSKYEVEAVLLEHLIRQGLVHPVEAAPAPPKPAPPKK